MNSLKKFNICDLKVNEQCKKILGDKMFLEGLIYRKFLFGVRVPKEVYNHILMCFLNWCRVRHFMSFHSREYITSVKVMAS